MIIRAGAAETLPSAACLSANNLMLGSQLTCVRSRETSGSCNPESYSFPSFNASAAGCP